VSYCDILLQFILINVVMFVAIVMVSFWAGSQCLCTQVSTPQPDPHAELEGVAIDPGDGGRRDGGTTDRKRKRGAHRILWDSELAVRFGTFGI